MSNRGGGNGQCEWSSWCDLSRSRVQVWPLIHMFAATGLHNRYVQSTIKMSILWTRTWISTWFTTNDICIEAILSLDVVASIRASIFFVITLNGIRLRNNYIHKLLSTASRGLHIASASRKIGTRTHDPARGTTPSTSRRGCTPSSRASQLWIL